MLQNKLLFNQSSVSLEIIGLPDYSNNEYSDQISIISQWKLMIIDKPLIEGNFEHLSCIMEAFYNYSTLLINNQIAIYESKLIDIRSNDFLKHNVLLKSSKLDVEPLNIQIGNSILSDIIHCFNQFNSSDKVRKVNLNILEGIPKKSNFNLINKDKIISIFLPPFISLCSLFLASTALIYIYEINERKENTSSINSNLLFNSVKSKYTIV